MAESKRVPSGAERYAAYKAAMLGLDKAGYRHMRDNLRHEDDYRARRQPRAGGFRKPRK